MSNTRSKLEKRLARLLAITPSFTQQPEVRPRVVDVVYLDPATQDRLNSSLRE